MSRDNSLPFERGTTAYQGNPIDANNLDFADLLGQIKRIEDKKWGDVGAKGDNSAAYVEIMAVRNKVVAGVTPGQSVELDPANPFEILQTSQTVAGPYVIVDEYLPAAGCILNDVCWVVVNGPANCKLTPGNAADAAAGTFWQNDATAKGTLVPYTPADDKAIAAFKNAVYAGWGMALVAKNAGVVNGRVWIRTKYKH